MTIHHAMKCDTCALRKNTLCIRRIGKTRANIKTVRDIGKMSMDQIEKCLYWKEAKRAS